MRGGETKGCGRERERDERGRERDGVGGGEREEVTRKRLREHVYVGGE